MKACINNAITTSRRSANRHIDLGRCETILPVGVTALRLDLVEGHPDKQTSQHRQLSAIRSRASISGRRDQVGRQAVEWWRSNPSWHAYAPPKECLDLGCTRQHGTEDDSNIRSNSTGCSFQPRQCQDWQWRGR